MSEALSFSNGAVSTGQLWPFATPTEGQKPAIYGPGGPDGWRLDVPLCRLSLQTDSEKPQACPWVAH